MKTKELSLNRVAPRTTYTIGKFFDGESFRCDTLEDPVRVLKDTNGDGDFDDPGEGKIYGETAFLAGRYEVVLDYSTRFKKIMPHILGVQGFEGIRIHWGSFAKDTHGCVLVGKNTEKGMLTSSRTTYAALLVLLRKYFSQGYRVFITVK